MKTDSKGNDRKRQIILVARSLLAREGEAGFSLREVAKEVGIKLASLQYHFPTKADLVDAILKHTIDTYNSELDSLPSYVDGSPEEALLSALQWLSGTDQVEEEEVRLEIHLWAMALNDPSVQASLEDYHKTYLNKIADLVEKANPNIDEAEARKRAVMIASLQEGSMLFTNGNVDDLTQKQILEQLYQSSLKIAFG